MQKQIVDFLISLPNMHDIGNQEALIYYAGLDRELEAQIPFGKPAAQFIQSLVATLIDYGQFNEGLLALVAILEAAKVSVEKDGKLVCESLIQELRIAIENTFNTTLDFSSRKSYTNNSLPTNSHLIGRVHNAHLHWLLNDWINSNSPVCFLEGFPGTGKTAIARALIDQVREAKLMAGVMIEAPETEKDPTDDILLDLAAELNSAGEDELARAIENNRPLLDVLSNIVKNPILIIIDEFQRSMQGLRARTLGGFAKVLSTLANRKWLKGRILLLSNRLIERAKWSEPYAIRTLKGMTPSDGIELLEYFAKEGGRIDEIDPEHRHDVVKLLGGNPRAIQLLVRNLSYDSLDYLIGEERELWENIDREVSPEFVEELERKLLEKTLKHLSEDYIRYLHRLSVHRKSFSHKAIARLFEEKDVFAQFKKEMINRFLMEQHRGWFTLHPIAREIGLQKLSQSLTDFQQAHKIAAQYHTCHFEAEQIKKRIGALGGHFVEASYHLLKAGYPENLKPVASRFQGYIFFKYNGASSIPDNLEELNERIAVLSAALQESGPKNLHYYLARLFQVRNQRNDLGRGLNHAQRATSRKNAAPWLLCSELLLGMERIEDAIAVLRRGIKCVLPDSNLADLFNRCSELLSQAGRDEEAISLLLNGIEHIPPDKSLATLYISCGELLAPE